MTCQEFFEKHRGDNDKCKHLQKEPLRIEWQKETASKHSPKPVSDAEDLSRQVFSPIHIDIDSKSLKPSALSDAENKGLSVFRLNYSDEKKVIHVDIDINELDNCRVKNTIKTAVSISNCMI